MAGFVSLLLAPNKANNEFLNSVRLQFSYNCYFWKLKVHYLLTNIITWQFLLVTLIESIINVQINTLLIRIQTKQATSEKT